MLEPVLARALPPGELEAYGKVVVLDDVTPHYVRASALDACRAGLGVALHCLVHTETSGKAGCRAACRKRLRAGRLGRSRIMAGNSGSDRA